jgi:hypothetical protein
MNHSDIKSAVSKILNDPLVGKGTFSVEDLIADAVMRLQNAAIVPVKRGRPVVKNTKPATKAASNARTIREILNVEHPVTPNNLFDAPDQS